MSDATGSAAAADLSNNRSPGLFPASGVTLGTPSPVESATGRGITLTGGQLDFGVYAGKTVTIESPAAYNDGRWHFVVATQGAGGMHLYVDGAQVASGSTTGAAAYSGSWQLGGTVFPGWPSRPSGAFSGAISDAAVFAGELTAAQVKAQYTSSPAG